MPTNHTILLVEDETLVRHFMVGVLKKAGYGILEARSAVEAKAALRCPTGVISLVISDIQMPGGNGLDLAVDLGIEHPTLPLLFVSGLLESVAVASILLRDRRAILTKPFTSRELLCRVREFLPPDSMPLGHQSGDLSRKPVVTEPSHQLQRRKVR